MCAKHFEDIMFMNSSSKNQLRHDAVPTVFNVPNAPQTITVRRKLPIGNPHFSKKRVEQFKETGLISNRPTGKLLSTI